MSDYFMISRHYKILSKEYIFARHSELMLDHNYLEKINEFIVDSKGDAISLYYKLDNLKQNNIKPIC